MQRLSNDNYKNPPVSFTDTLSKDDIQKLLEDYDQIDDIANLMKGIHLRYFKKEKNGEYLFRMGGILLINKYLDGYIILSNGKKTWSVQIKNTIFFQKKSLSEIKNLFENKLKEKNNEINNLIKINEEKEKECDHIKKKYNNLKKGKINI
jgi:hypothetical protein